MKHLKIYEDFEYKYNVGDYVVLDFKNQDIYNFLEDNVLIYDDVVEVIKIEYNSNHHYYKVVFNNGYDFNVMEHEILRYANKDEIDTYNSKKAIVKYNI